MPRLLTDSDPWFAPLLVLCLLARPAYGQLTSPIADGAQVQFLTDGLAFGEGPVWHPDGFLLFSDVLADRVMRLDPESGVKEIFFSPSGEANGLGLDSEQRLIMCRRMARDVARLESDGTVTILASEYRGEAFNSPNDIAIRSDGTMFFTDPNPSGDPSRVDGVYSLTPAGIVHRLDSGLAYSNGIALSPDEQQLYVIAADSQIVYQYAIENDSTLTNKSVFTHVTDTPYLDGMKVDEDSLVYVTGGGGVWIYGPRGDLVDQLDLPGTTTNVNFGDSDYRGLYITQKEAVLRIQLRARGSSTFVTGDPETPTSSELTVMPNYPNPLTSTTTISYLLSSAQPSYVRIYDVHGRVIRLLRFAGRSKGLHRLVWDGRDESGRSVPNGVYVCQVVAGGRFASTLVVVQR